MIRRSVFIAVLCAAAASMAQAQSTASAPKAAPAASVQPVELGTELIKIDTVIGTGPEAASGKTVVVHYTGWLFKPLAPRQRGRKFDSSVEREPLDFPLGAGRVIKGWDLGVAGMKVGGKRTLVIPASLGYGAAGYASIPPNAGMVFEVELLTVIR